MDYLILKLEGPMQAWGTHTFEDYRPTQPFPTLSAIIGLLGACLGIHRHERDRLIDLGDSLEVTIRADQRPRRDPVTITDFHTVLDARKVGGGVNPHPVVSRREYLCDAGFTLVLAQRDAAVFDLETIAEAVKKPFYTPFLGRRSCPLTRPLFERWCQADCVLSALAEISPGHGLVYSCNADLGSSRRMVRDVPLPGHRQFGTRQLGVIVSKEQHGDVSK
ncbi:type I-E CRISPR-associated protein Cas5/CasD [Ectothiorhodospira shaposhnikovii]|uniref:type I-E CRISPR-associated protein Cas5/CasD n=1 Tax=Ectothiorhodospira shaposhnikovii TaxID=1054 RepID=UPI0039A17DCD